MTVAGVTSVLLIVIAIAVLVYLMAALINPERFS